MDKEFDVAAIDRLHKKIDIAQVDMPLILTQLSKSDYNKSIFRLAELGNMFVTTEPQKPKSTLPQCHRCQNHGHNSPKS